MNIHSPNNRSKVRKQFSIRRILVTSVFFIFLFGAYWASKSVRTKGYDGLLDFIQTISSNYFKGLKANPEEIAIEIKDDDFKKLEKNRKQALERGVIINDLDGEYVPATMNYNGKKIDVKLRLKGHMTDHLQNNKWSFRIKTKGNDSFMGMKRFSIQHPGTRGYIYEWIYHELMKREGVIALRYKFINVNVNGKDWGIYAVEENFENELLENNNRKKGPILRFNPDLYWINRYNQYIRQNSYDEYASYYSANPEAYREDKVLEDTVQYNYYLKAIALIEGLRNKKIAVDKAFDIPLLAKFHAIVDLVGGTHSIDWSDIKYYYNPITARLEPVAYESFTNLSSRDLSCLYKNTTVDSVSNYIDWHTMLFSNNIFFSEYMKELERITSPSYLDTFFNSSNIELKQNLAIICKEFPYKKFDASGYYDRQNIIKKIIETPKGIHAYFKKIDGNNAIVQIGAIDALPIVVKSISINGVKSTGNSDLILDAKQKNNYVEFIDYTFYMPTPPVLKGKNDNEMNIQYSVLGSSAIKEAKIFPFPHTDNEFIADDLKNKQSTLSNFPDFQVDEQNKLIYLNSKKLIINSDLIVPSGYKVLIGPGTAIDLKNHAKIISYSALIFEGNEEERIIVESSDATSEGIQVIGANTSIFKYVTFKNLPKIHDQQWDRTAAITCYESPVNFNFCSFYNCAAEDAINLIRSDFSFKGCLFHKMHDDALDIDYSSGTIDNCAFEECNENALDILMSKVTINSIVIDKAGNKAVSVKDGSQVVASNIKIMNANIAISSEDLSSMDFRDVAITDSKIGVVAYKNKRGAGHPTIKVNAVLFKNVETTYLKEKKSSIFLNGKEMNEVTIDVEAIIKDGKKKNT